LQQQIVEKREEKSDLLLKQCVEVLHFSQIVEKRTAEDLLATAVWKFAAANCWREREAGGSATFVSLA
jgi:hypothetical protein